MNYIFEKVFRVSHQLRLRLFRFFEIIFFLNQFFIFFAISACTQPQISTDLMIFSCTIYLPLWCSLSSSNHSEVGLLVLLIVRVVYVVLMQVFHQESDLQVFSSRPYLIFSFYEWFFFFFFLILWVVVFETQKFFILMKSILLIMLLSFFQV